MSAGSTTAGRRVGLHLDTEGGVVELDTLAAVFDCDGLLVDSESIWLQMISEWLDAHGLNAGRAEEFLGLSVNDTAARLASQGKSGDPGRIAAELTVRYTGLLRSGVSPMPGAVALFTGLAQHIPVAVASNGLRRDVTAMLADSGLLDLAQSVSTLEDVTEGKPFPDLYLAACRKLGVPPELAVAFEDSPAGAQAASAAGLTVVGVNPDPAIDLPCHWRLTGLDRAAIVSTH